MAECLCFGCKWQADRAAYQGGGYPHLVCQKAGEEQPKGRKRLHYVMHPGDDWDTLMNCSVYEEGEVKIFASH